MPLPTYKQSLEAKGSKRSGASVYKFGKKSGSVYTQLNPSFYAAQAKKANSGPETGRDLVGEKKIKKSSTSFYGTEVRPNNPEQIKPPKIVTLKTDRVQKVSFYGQNRNTPRPAYRKSDYNVVKSQQPPTNYVNYKRLAVKASQRASLMNLKRLKRDGRKTPDDYRKIAIAAQSPSQLSLKSISELYTIQPNTNFTSVDDVYRYRGYRKLQKIDEGAFGIVSKAMRLSDRILVAVKEVDLRKKRAKRIEEMKRELFVLQKVEDKNVVRLIEHFVVDQMLVIIMEYCAGGNLTSYLKETAINEQEALHLFKQMVFSIKVLHRKGIAHRDVKLNNFLLDSTRKFVKIGDFGLSVVSYLPNIGVLMAKTYCGTEPYMAPEVLKRNSLGARSYNPLYTDIWSLGVCLFAMLTRTFPFKMHTSQHGLFRAQVSRRWRFPRSLRDMLSEEIKDLVWHMLDPEPERRISINGVVAHPWLNQNQLIVLSYGESDTESSIHSSTK